MRYRRAKLDSTHAPMVELFEACGCSVLDLAAVGGGCPDVLVGRNGRSVLVEFKRPGWKPTIKGNEAVTAARQALWAERWRGCPIVRVQTEIDARAVLARLGATA